MMRRFRWSIAAGAVLASLLGCRSPWIQCTIVNHESTPVSLVEVSYPGGSFGVQTIAAGGNYHYRFHSLGTDAASLDFTDAARQSHSVKGPELKQNQEGSLQIDILGGNQVTWTVKAGSRQ
jgi:VCBS repeat-containing protein